MHIIILQVEIHCIPALLNSLFKRYVMPSAAGTPKGVFFLSGDKMHIYLYSDESGVLDKAHNEYYVFGGVIFLSKEDKENYSRKYIGAEKNIRLSEDFDNKTEIKASNISPKSKNKLYTLMKHTERFGVVVSQNKLDDKLFQNKKTKQRYLDWVYKMAVKSKLQELISTGIIVPSEVEAVDFFIDEHLTATNGLYELKESLEKEFKIGMWNFKYMTFYPPLFPNIDFINLKFCNSAKTTLVRSADIIANHIFYIANRNKGIISHEDKLHIFYHP